MLADQLKVGMTYTGTTAGSIAALTITGFQACYFDNGTIYPDNASHRFRTNASSFYAVGTLDSGKWCFYLFNRQDTVTVRDRKDCDDCHPNNAKWHTSIVYGRNVGGDPNTTVTDYEYAFMCEPHKVKPRTLLPENDPTWIRAARWKVLEHRTVNLDKRRFNSDD